jgi:hypothetical protein
MEGNDGSSKGKKSEFYKPAYLSITASGSGRGSPGFNERFTMHYKIHTTRARFS